MENLIKLEDCILFLYIVVCRWITPLLLEISDLKYCLTKDTTSLNGPGVRIKIMCLGICDTCIIILSIDKVFLN